MIGMTTELRDEIKWVAGKGLIMTVEKISKTQACLTIGEPGNASCMIIATRAGWTLQALYFIRGWMRCWGTRNEPNL